MSKKRKQYSPEEKVSILRRHLLDSVPVSDLCDAHGIHPTMFYKWQKVFSSKEPQPLPQSKVCMRNSKPKRLLS